MQPNRRGRDAEAAMKALKGREGGLSAHRQSQQF